MMVKAPRVKHSKTEREPLTIELEPGAVSRVAEPKEAGMSEAREALAETPNETPDQGAPDAQLSDAPLFETKADSAEKPLEQEGFDASQSTFGRSTFNEAPPASSTRRETPDAVPPATGGTGRALLAGVAGGAIALVFAAGLQAAGLIPGSAEGDGVAVQSLQGELASLKQEIATLKEGSGASGIEAVQAAVVDSTARIDSLTALVDQLKAGLAQVQEAVASGGAGDGAAVQALDARIKQIETAVAAMGTADASVSEAAIAALTDRLATAETAVGAATAAVTANDGRLAALEQAVGEISKQIESQGDQPKVAMAIAAAALRAALDRGGTFTAEVETFAAIAPDSPELPALREVARKGVASRTEILAETSAVADAMVSAEVTVGEEAGFFERLWGSAASLVTVRPIGAVEGEGVPPTVARMEAAIKEGNLAKALVEYDTLPAAPKAAGAAFAEKIRARIAAEELVDRALAGSMRGA